MSNEKRIFTDEKRKEFSKDCMQLALEALEKGDIEKAKYWCRRQDETKNIIHDLYMTWVTALMSYIHEHMGEEEAENRYETLMDAGIMP
jgi:Tfp pilus assembly protein PilF